MLRPCHNSSWLHLALACGLCASPSLLFAGNIVQNPGFESGDSSDWTTGGANLVCQTGTMDFGVPCLVNSGQYAYNSDTLLAQTLTTVAGQVYTLSFYYATEIDGEGAGTQGEESNSFAVQFGGNTVYGPLTDVHQPTYLQVVIPDLTATSASTLLSFNMTNGPGGFWLDDISVDPAPEPGTAGFTALALAACWFGRKYMGKRFPIDPQSPSSHT